MQQIHRQQHEEINRNKEPKQEKARQKSFPQGNNAFSRRIPVADYIDRPQRTAHGKTFMQLHF